MQNSVRVGVMVKGCYSGLEKYRFKVVPASGEDAVFHARAIAEQHAANIAGRGIACMLFRVSYSLIGEVSQYLCEYAPAEVLDGHF